MGGEDTRRGRFGEFWPGRVADEGSISGNLQNVFERGRSGREQSQRSDPDEYLGKVQKILGTRTSGTCPQVS